MSFVPSAGKARRSQGISTFGIGSIVDFTTGSYMPLGLYHMDQQWYGMSTEEKEAIVFYEPRLQKLLGVRSFRGLPTPGEGQLGNYGDRVKSAWGVPCVRFPSWLECPKCHRLGKIDDPFEQDPNGKVTCLACKTDVNPVRFVVTCRKGHIDDFPWLRWAHQDRADVCPDPAVKLKSRGKSAALGDLYLECRCGSVKGLAGIFTGGEMKKFRCRGRRPWLLSSEKCGDDVITLQRGGSNVYFPVIASMISIPPASEAISKILEPHWAWLSVAPEEALPQMIEGFFDQKDISVDPRLAADWVRRRKGIETDDASGDEQNARFQEFQSLIEECRPVATEAHRPEFENAPFTPSDKLLPWIDLVSAVHRLREVRALCGFTRIQPYSLNIEDIPDAVHQKKIAPLSAGQMSWRPAVEVRGEGIFLQLGEERVTRWASDPAVVKRAGKINKIFTDRCARDGAEPPYQITPRHLLVHSLAHVLIRRMSLDCGYSSASLRERLYISDGDGAVPAMAGILIYTASPDSDGSLGGIINLASPERIDSLIERAIQDAQWCGNDPVCIETDPQINGERLSAAACHNCLLVPETACEKFNRELDRGTLLGFPAGAGGEVVPGFFTDFPLDY
jgi:hypothetical protein